MTDTEYLERIEQLEAMLKAAEDAHTRLYEENIQLKAKAQELNSKLSDYEFAGKKMMRVYEMARLAEEMIGRILNLSDWED